MSMVGLGKSELDTPALWVDLDQLERNIAHMAGHCHRHGVGWRPHTKGIKVPAIAHMAMSTHRGPESPGALGVTCAKLGEAEVMAAAGISDILIANEIVTPQKIVRLVNLARRADVKVAVDNAENVARLGAAARAAGVQLGVLVDVNIGMQRAGVEPGQPTLELARRVHETEGLRFLGVTGWEGHTIGIADPAAKRSAVEQAVGLLTSSADLCRQAGLPVQIVSGGGSGTYVVGAALPGLTEIEAGGAIFCDETYLKYGVKTEPALFVRSTVTSRPAPDRIIFDAGFKALPTWHGMPRPLGLPPITSLKASAEHATIVLQQPDRSVNVGDAFDFVLGYGDATVFLYDQLHGVRNGIVEVIWDIAARGKLA